MALHRDIYWVGRQWAVTGYGIQACDQKQKGKFDIEASRLWEDGVLESLRAEQWLNREDFEKAIAAARKHYPEPPRKSSRARRRAFRGRLRALRLSRQDRRRNSLTCESRAGPPNSCRCGVFAFGDSGIEWAGFASTAIAR